MAIETPNHRKLLIIGCANRKRSSPGLLPALARYDGPTYRVLRTFLRQHQWPEDLSIAILSAKYGLFGVLTGIENYDLTMDASQARATADKCMSILDRWSSSHHSYYISLSKDYMPAVEPALRQLGVRPEVFHGGQGEKLHHIRNFLANSGASPRVKPGLQAGSGVPSYFLPDWDDLLDPHFNFEADRFSAGTRIERADQHCSQLMESHRLSDGILVSLAQRLSTKGPLRRLKGTEMESLAPVSLRRRFGLGPDQYLFGDCGAFSYVNEQEPTMSVEHAVALYESYGFDFGASVDHIPIPAIRQNGARTVLTRKQLAQRVAITALNARSFMEAVQSQQAQFIPVGTIQALSPDQHARYVRQYYDYGYRHLAIGGLVFRTDREIEQIVQATMAEADKLPERPWVHLFGIFRPNLQETFRRLKVDSFDSASYFRKAWLRSDQNYLARDNEWYAAIRVPMTTDPRLQRHLSKEPENLVALQNTEREVLNLLSRYDREEVNIDEVLDAVLHYDQLLPRSSEHRSLRESYRRTLVKRPWKDCDCTFCRTIGIHMLIFRGANRNKRRGAHNTLMMYQLTKNTAALSKNRQDGDNKS